MFAAGSLILALLLAAPLDDDATFRAGQDLYQQLEFEEALIRFQEVALSTDHSDEERAIAFVWVGLAYAQLGRFDTAAESFERAVRADEAVKLPPGVSPKIKKVFAGAAASAKKALAKERAAAEGKAKAEAEARAKEEAAAEAKRLEEQRAAEERAARASAEWERHKQEGAAAAQPPAAATGEVAAGGAEGTGAASVPHEEPPETSGFGSSMAYWAGAATGGVIGGALAAGGVGLLGASYLVFTYAASPTTPQVPAAQALSVANSMWLASLGVGAVGVLALAAGATSATLAVVQAE